jgi:uncharacterized membrane protein
MAQTTMATVEVVRLALRMSFTMPSFIGKVMDESPFMFTSWLDILVQV